MELKIFLYCGRAGMSLGEGLEPLLDSEPRVESILTFYYDVESLDGCSIVSCSVAREGGFGRH